MLESPTHGLISRVTMESPTHDPRNSAAAPFRSTRWTRIARAGSDDPEARARGLSEFCGDYRGPLYAFLRRSGSSPDEAADLVQGFLAHIIERQGLDRVERRPLPGARFRTWLLTSLRNHVRDDHARRTAAKRGGGRRDERLDVTEWERLVPAESAATRTPEEEFERTWALQVLSNARESLRDECIRSGRGDLFRCLEATLDGEQAAGARAALAQRLGMSAVAVRVAIHRLRKRYTELIHEEVRGTLDLDVDDGRDPATTEFELLREALS